MYLCTGSRLFVRLIILKKILSLNIYNFYFKYSIILRRNPIIQYILASGDALEIFLCKTTHIHNLMIYFIGKFEESLKALIFHIFFYHII